MAKYTCPNLFQICTAVNQKKNPIEISYHPHSKISSTHKLIRSLVVGEDWVSDQLWLTT